MGRHHTTTSLSSLLAAAALLLPRAVAGEPAAAGPTVLPEPGPTVLPEPGPTVLPEPGPSGPTVLPEPGPSGPTVLPEPGPKVSAAGALQDPASRQAPAANEPSPPKPDGLPASPLAEFDTPPCAAPLPEADPQRPEAQATPAAGLDTAAAGTGAGGGPGLRLLPPVEGEIVVIDPGHGGTNTGALGPAQTEEKEITLALARRVKLLLEDASDLRVAMTRLRDTHLGLRERAAVANQLGARVLLSIHCNSAGYVGPRGHEAYFASRQSTAPPPQPDGGAGPVPVAAPGAPAAAPAAFAPNGGVAAAKPAASAAQLGASAARQPAPGPTATEGQQDSALLAALVEDEMASRLAGPSRGVRQAGFDVLIHSRPPATVVEVGFLNHPEEGLLLTQPAYQERIARALASSVLRFLGQRALPADRPWPRPRSIARPAASRRVSQQGDARNTTRRSASGA